MSETGTVLREGLRTGWSDAETALLKKELAEASRTGQPLKVVFDKVALATGRKPNSIRNYYYANLRGRPGTEDVPPARMPFNTFSDDEVRTLLRQVLTAQAKGISVRRCTMDMGGGDRTQMLRYQNKYRSVLKTHPAMVREIVKELRAEGVAAYDPYSPVSHGAGEVIDVDAVSRELANDLNTLGETGAALLASLKGITSMAMRHQYGRRKAADYDALAARYDLLVTRMVRIQDAVQQFLAKGCPAERAEALAQRVADLSSPQQD